MGWWNYDCTGPQGDEAARLMIIVEQTNALLRALTVEEQQVMWAKQRESWTKQDLD